MLRPIDDGSAGGGESWAPEYLNCLECDKGARYIRRSQPLSKDVAQVPRHVFTGEARYWNPSRLLPSVQGRFLGNQFDDDQNQYPLGQFYTMDLQVGRNLTRNVEVFAAAENITDKRYFVAYNPWEAVPFSTSAHRFLFASGLRLNFPAERK